MRPANTSRITTYSLAVVLSLIDYLSTSMPILFTTRSDPSDHLRFSLPGHKTKDMDCICSSLLELTSDTAAAHQEKEDKQRKPNSKEPTSLNWHAVKLYFTWQKCNCNYIQPNPSPRRITGEEIRIWAELDLRRNQPPTQIRSQRFDRRCSVESRGCNWRIANGLIGSCSYDFIFIRIYNRILSTFYTHQFSISSPSSSPSGIFVSGSWSYFFSALFSMIYFYIVSIFIVPYIGFSMYFLSFTIFYTYSCPIDAFPLSYL